MGLKQTIASWLSPSASEGVKLPGPGDDFWYQSVGGKGYSGVTITPQTALRVSTVHACCRIIAEAISSMPFNVFEKTATGRIPRPGHPLDSIISTQPNKTQTAVEFWEMMILQQILEGTAYAEIVPGRRGLVDQLLPIRTARVTPKRARDGSLRFIVTNDPTQPGPSQRRILLEHELFRLVGMSADGMQGLKAVDLAADAIGLSSAADQYAGRVFSNALNIGGFLVHPGRLSDQGQKNLIQALVSKFAGPQNAHRPIVLQEGMDFKPATLTARNAQMIEARVHQIKEIARVFRVPDHMLGIRDSQPRANVEQDAIDFVKYTLRPWVKRIEQATTRDLISRPDRFVAKMNLDALLRGDSASRAEYFSKALGSGGSPAWMTQNEVRVIEGYNPIPGEADALPKLPEITPTAPGIGSAPEAGVQEIKQLPAPALAIPTRGPSVPLWEGDEDISRLVIKEVGAVRKKRERHAGDREAFNDAIKAFYGGHVSSVMSFLDIPKEAARAYCAHQQSVVLGAEDVEELLDVWEDTLKDELVATLLSRRDERTEDD